MTEMSTPSKTPDADMKHAATDEKPALAHLENGDETVANGLPPNYFRSMNFIGTMVAAGASYGSVSVFQMHNGDGLGILTMIGNWRLRSRCTDPGRHQRGYRTQPLPALGGLGLHSASRCRPATCWPTLRPLWTPVFLHGRLHTRLDRSHCFGHGN